MRGKGAGLGVWLLVVVGVAGASLSAPLAAATAAPAIAVGVWRNAFGTAVTLPFVVARHGRGTLRGLPPRAWGWSLLAGVQLAVHFGTWLTSLRMTSVVAATALVSTTPVWVVAIDVLRGVRVPAAVVGGTVLAIAGGVAITGVDAASSARALAGDGLAVVGALSFAAYLAAGERARRDLTTAEYTLLAYGTCALSLVPVALVTGAPLGGYAAVTWAQLLAITVSAQLLGHSLLNAVLPRVGGTAIALALLFEVPGATLVAWAWPGQAPSAWVVPGTAMMLAGLAVVVRAGRGAASQQGVVEVT
jgi:drug/metabolite transporter (DMT)-like permease